MQSKLSELRARLCEINDLQAAGAVLGWDQSTYMPPGGATARARQMATLGKLAHAKRVDPALGRLLEDLSGYEESLPYDSEEASLIRVARREYERAVKVPPEFVAEYSSHGATSYELWTKARPANDFAALQTSLEKTLELSRQLADFFPGYEHIADPLIDFADYGMKASTLQQLFSNLREQLVPLVKTVTAQPAPDASCLMQHFPEAKQWAFGLDVIRRFGYDFERGRQDKVPHPFTTSFAVGDVRITTRIHEDDLRAGLFATMHEAGHALYEQGCSREYEGTPLQGGTSAGVHESQSRLWENIVGRSLGFWRFFFPRLQKVFPDQLSALSLETFHRAVNRVAPSLIRVEADELTYNLHVIIRFDLELAMLEGRLAVADLPAAWRERYEGDLGVAAPDDRDGVLQDMHWFTGQIGGVFQGYTLGNVLSAHFYEIALGAHPEIPAQIEQGEFDVLHNWLKETIYRHGSKYTAPEIIERVTGGPLTIEPYIRYLKEKYGELYGV